MNWRRVIARLDRWQHARGFKIAASALVLLIAVIGFSVYYLAATGPNADGAAPAQAAQVDEAEGSQDSQRVGVDEQARRTVEAVLRAQRSPTEIAYGIGIATAISIVVIWLGLGLTYLALLLLAAGVAYPLSLFGATAVYARILVGVVVLTASFTALMQGLRLALSAPNPIFAVARNVLAEAVRMKISLVFIVLLVFGLAALPGLLNEDTPLRYRVQSFLQYAAGGSFWMIALLTLFFGVASLTSEQRDKIIWQTITKPVAPWQYLFGKWLGVTLLAAVLLLVTSSGTFLFVEYLRSQPARGERVAYVSANPNVPFTPDRLILETQVLSARKSVEPSPPFERDDPDFLRAAYQKIEDERRTDPNFAATRAAEAAVIEDLYTSSLAAFRGVSPSPEFAREFVFEGLRSARNRDRVLLLRYQLDTGANNPDEVYNVTFQINGTEPFVQRSGLGHTHTVELLPSRIDENGRITLRVFNGALFRTNDGRVGWQPNPSTFTLPQGELTISYAAGSYQANYFRGVLVLWLKLAFLAMLAIWASTFLSFPVACMVAVGAFLTAESAGFLATALDRFGTNDFQGNFELWRALIFYVGSPVAWIFQIYAELKPITKVVDGQLISPGAVARGMSVLAVWSVALFLLGVLIFRRREMALYSGH
ncbi:MAG: hypothetical protein AAGK04_08810 [Planctomycetota bacterium]